MSDGKLRSELISLGYTPGPITDSTRGVLENKLEKLRLEANQGSSSRRSENATKSRRREPQVDSSAEDKTWETLTSDWRRQSHGQPPKERASWDTVLEESSWRGDRRVDESRYFRSSFSSPAHIEESALQKTPLAYNLGYNRHSTDIPERSSIDYNRYSTDIPERSSTGYNRYSTDIPERSSTGYNRYSTDIPETSSIDYNRFSGDELRYRRISDSIRDQRKSRYISSNRPSLDSLSRLTYDCLKQEKMSHLKPSWSKKLEHYLSRLLRLLCVVLVLVFSGILIMKSGILSTSQDDGMKLLPSDCEGRQDPFCKAKQKEITLRILSELYDFLSLQAGSFECGNPSGLSSKCVPINTAKEHVLNVSGFAAEKFDAALEWILSSDKHLGIWAKGEGTEEPVTVLADVFCVESSRPRLGLICRLKNALYTAISNLFLALLGILLLWIVLIFLRYYWQRLEEEEKQIFVMVEKIIDVVKHHYKDWTLGREQNPYIGILHVRDSLIKPQDRKHLKRVWDRAVQFVEDNESRVRTELQRVAGADLRVWRWTQTRNERLR